MKKRSLLPAVALAVAACLVSMSGAAYADDLIVDGDTLETGTQDVIDLGTVACGGTAAEQVILHLKSTGHSGQNQSQQVFGNGTSIGVIATTSAPLTVAVGAGLAAVITVPGNWEGTGTYPNNTQAPDTATATVTLNAGTQAGSFTGAVSFSGSGTNWEKKPITVGPIVKTVRWTVADCQMPTTTSVICPESAVYTGTAIAPCHATVTGTNFSQSLPVEYTPNVNVGTVTASASFAGTGAYGPSSDSTTFEILPAAASCSVSGYEGVYDGGAHGATGSCTGVDGTDVSQGLDLGASFIDVPGGTAAWAFALPNYVSQGGLAEIVISKAPSTVTVTCPDSVAFSGAPIEPCTAEVTGAGGLSQAVPVTYVGNKLAGTATASAKYDGDANHLASEVVAHTFAIIGWTRLGFYKPVDMGNDVLNVVKGGSTVPLKFTVLDQGTEVTDLAKLGATFTAREITCDMGDMPSDDLFTTTGSTSLRYDATAHQWIQNWQTPKTAGKCYRVTLTTADGLSLQAQFKIK